MSYSLDNVAGILEARGDRDGALERYERSLSICERLLGQEETPESLRDVSYSLDNVAGILMARGDLDGALERYERSLRLRRDLLESAYPSPLLIGEIAESFAHLGDVHRGLCDVRRALERLEEGLEVVHGYVQLIQDVGDLEPIVRLTLRLARCRLELGCRGPAKAAIGFAVQAVTDIERQFPEHVRHLESCADWWDVRAAVAAAEGNPAEQASHAAHAAMLRARIAALRGAHT